MDVGTELVVPQHVLFLQQHLFPPYVEEVYIDLAVGEMSAAGVMFAQIILTGNLQDVAMRHIHILMEITAYRLRQHRIRPRLHLR